MTKAEAIQQAKTLSTRYERLFVIFDKELNDFFISEGENFHKFNNFYETCNYEVIKVFESSSY